MTVADAPTMPLNCLTAGAPLAGDPFGPGAGAMLVLVVCDIFGATRREPDPSSVIGLARVRVWSSGELISMAGNGFDADCWASAAEIPNARIGPRTVDASRQLRRRCTATMAEDMARTSA
ncbi:MAG TPA: hypothetical protein VK554_08935 [Bradyrhizobium sp.]|nr:hypothetical protein [Bradyrhizobium sp.]